MVWKIILVWVVLLILASLIKEIYFLALFLFLFGVKSEFIWLENILPWGNAICLLLIWVHAWWAYQCLNKKLNLWAIFVTDIVIIVIILWLPTESYFPFWH